MGVITNESIILQQSTYSITNNKISSIRKALYPVESTLKEEGDIARLCAFHLTSAHKSKNAREFASLEVANRSESNILEFGYWLKLAEKTAATMFQLTN